MKSYKSIKLIFFFYSSLFIEKRLAAETSSTTPPTTETSLDMQTCEHCGKTEPRQVGLKTKIFCSQACLRAAKKLNSVAPTSTENIESKSTTDETKKIPAAIPDEKLDETINNGVAADKPEVENIIDKWSVQDVYEFIKNLPGFSDYAEDFAVQEIDGQALSLLNDNHLVNTMGMKLGPALKILAKVQSLKTPEIPPQ